ncbi:putative cytochrome P450 6a14 [Papilio machaon]|uniref:unspecific monooxygenase n=1 Tax=Papilio machaon TaxID=76193 RepID=A0A0N1IF03_PAPMA|nr:putative cytochrome P450 6a14 [Papilio machaon]
MYPDEPVVAVASLFTPALYVKDVTNVNHVLNVNFNSFSHRGFEVNEGDQLADNVLFMNDRSALDFVEYLKQRPELLKKDTFQTLNIFCSAAIGASVFDLCVGLINKGMLKDHDTGLEIQPTEEILAAQAFFFFVAGVEPTATAMFGILVELGRNPEQLRRLHEEIDNSFEKHDKMTYDIVNEMEYLDMVYNEALRMHPPIGNLLRQCNKDTVLPVGNVRVDAGTKIFLPIYDIHHDPKIYPDPEVFNPERFSPENSKNINSNAFMPFGEGKRLCIGIRYATLQAKSGLVHLLRNFAVKTHVGQGGIKYYKQNVQVKPTNVDVQLIPRDLRKNA